MVAFCYHNEILNHILLDIMKKYYYELALVLSANLPEQKINDLIDKIKELLPAKNPQIKSEILPKKQLSYPINHEKEAIYVFLTITNENLSPEFMNKIKVFDGVLRYMLLRRNGLKSAAPGTGSVKLPVGREKSVKASEIMK